MLAVLSVQQLRYECESGQLAVLDAPMRDTARDIGLMTRTGSPLSPAARALINAIRVVATEVARAPLADVARQGNGVATGARKPIGTIGECVQIHVADKGAEWKDRKTRIQILTKYAPEYEDQDALDLYDWSIRFAGFMRSNVDRHRSPKKPSADGTIHNTLGYLRAAIKYAHKIGKLEYDQTAKMVIPRQSEERHVHKGRREMLEIVRTCTHRETRAAIRVAFYSGMRMSEILRAVPTKDGFSLGRTRNGRPRLIPIHPRIAVIARRVKFTVPAWKVNDEWIKARRKSGHLDVRFHDLRHSAASEMINAGIDLYTVAGVLGHKTTTSTKRYAHLVTDRLAEAVKKIGRS